ncbi:MAG: FAD-binding oxidoreductase [Puniceicoccaceae bacterium]
MSSEYDQMKESIAGTVLLPGDTGFEEARQVWNARLNRMPEAILQCENAADVSMGVSFATSAGKRISVRGGGHSYAGLGTGENTLLIDLSKMKSIKVDVKNRSAQIGPGALWGEVNEATLPHGLAAAGGTVPSVGVAGFTLGGGAGWLAGSHGLAVDNLVSAEVVTADGSIVQCSESENLDLFWATRGGAGNFGIVTDFKMRLHPIPAQIFAGQVLYPLEAAEKVLQVYREVIDTAPDAFGCFPAMFRIPPIEVFPEPLHGQVVINLIIGHMGPVDEGEATAKPLREITEPIMDLCGPQSYADLLKVFEPGSPPGMRWYSRSQYFSELSDELIQAFIGQSSGMQGALSFAYFGKDRGAVANVASDAMAFPHRNGDYVFHLLSGWMSPDEDQAIMQWSREFNQTLRPMAEGGVYVNLMAEDETDRIGEAYGDNFSRLAEIKRKWDPQNLFQGNQNIKPA